MARWRLSAARMLAALGVPAACGALVEGAALAVPAVGTTLASFALAGLGVATLVPAAMHTADELPGLPDGTGPTIVSWRR